MHRNGFGEEYMPLVFRDDAGMMMTSALGNDGQGGGGGLTATNGGIRSLRNYFNKNGINSNSIDYLFDNFKRGTVDGIACKLAKNDPFVFSQPIKVVQAKGKTFILNGHHRIEAAIKMGYEGSIPFQRIPASQISQHSGFSNISKLLKAFGH